MCTASWLLATALLLGARTQSERPQVPAAEGALSNDVFLPVSESATRRLAEGDALYGRPAPAGADLAGACEAWRKALVESRAGDSVPGVTSAADPFPDPDRSHARRTEAVECAVVRRVLAGGPEALPLWRERFDALAALELAAAGADPERLARIERDFPLTASAARVAIALGDLAFERGDPEGARAWLGRAADHVRGDETAAVRAAIARRGAALATGAGADLARETATAWGKARSLRAISSLALPDAGGRESPAFRRGVRPGLALLDDGRVCVQDERNLHVVDADGRTAKGYALEDLAPGLDWSWIEAFGERERDWPLQPATDGARVLLVAGRAYQRRGNALLCVDARTSGRSPVFCWGWSERGWAAGPGNVRSLADALGPGVWEFEPGPLVAGEIALVQARQWTNEGSEEPPGLDERRIRSWCLALEIETGHVRWKRLLAIGADVLSARDARPGSEPRGLAGPAQPLVQCAGRVLAATEIGAAVLLDACDGRPLWSLKTRRRAADGAGWRSGAPTGVAGRAGDEASTAAFLLAPADSDRLYGLRGGADLDGRGLFLRDPAAIGSAEEFLGGDTARAIVLARTGASRAVAVLDLVTGARTNGLRLDLEDVFAGAALPSDARAIVATDRSVFLLDRTRDLYLLDSEPLSGRVAPGPDAVLARGARAWICGGGRLWSFAAE